MSALRTKYTAIATDKSRLASVIKTKKDYFQYTPVRKHYADLHSWMSEMTAAHPGVTFMIKPPREKEEEEGEDVIDMMGMNLARWTSLPEHSRTIHKVYDSLGIPNSLYLSGRKNEYHIRILTKRGCDLAGILYNRYTNEAKWDNGDIIEGLPYDAVFYSFNTACRINGYTLLQDVTLPLDKHHIVVDVPYFCCPPIQKESTKEFVDILTALGYHCIRPRPNITGTSPFWAWDFFTITHVRFDGDGNLEVIKSDESVNLPA